MTIFSNNLTAQQIFDHAVVQLALQGRPSVIGGNCAYRGEGGTKCGVGFLLKDEDITPEINTCGVDMLRRNGRLPARLIPHQKLLGWIQNAHDRAAQEYLESGPANYRRSLFTLLTRVASDYDLEKGVLYAAFPQPDAVEQKKAPLAKPKSFGAVMSALEQIVADYLYTQSNTTVHLAEGKG